MLFEKIELEPNEAVLKVIRKHWFIITIELLGTAFMLFIPFLLIVLSRTFPELIPTNLQLHWNSSLAIFLLSLWSLFALITGFMTWTNYYLDLWIITDRRIIAIDQRNFFNRKVSSFRLERLQDIKVIVKGIIPTLLNFGTIDAHTAATGDSEENFHTTGLPEPREIQSLIQKATDTRLASLHGNIAQILH